MSACRTHRLPALKLPLLSALAAALSCAPAMAEESGRYTMTPSPDGFVRLDTETGAVSMCSKKDGEWACRALPDDQRQLQDRVAKLEDENRTLRDENRRLEDVMGLNGPQAKGPRDEVAPGVPAPERIPVPTEKDVDRAFDYVEGMLRKFRERLKRLDDTPPGQADRPRGPDVPPGEPHDGAKPNGTRGT